MRLQHPTTAACDACGDRFLGQNGLNMHKKKAHRHPTTAACDACGDRFLGQNGLNMHKKKAHMVNIYI
ncbi:Zinc finger protein [Operophtera brumata]|uniref:Zinc finger protein n=1 Tax=Operophtera brumata TaxID=104452 RepID=A0A0L7KU89_OPEBR|nr:Zinc finger protein [Operophtera brumata]